MTAGVLARLETAALLIGVLALAYWIGTRIVLARARQGASGFRRFRRGLPGVVFFTTPDCMTCKAAQVPALHALTERLSGKVQLIEVDALQDAGVAKEWRVLSVPTTFILDREGTPRHVNHGFASTEKLFNQIQALGQA